MRNGRMRGHGRTKSRDKEHCGPAQTQSQTNPAQKDHLEALWGKSRMQKKAKANEHPQKLGSFTAMVT